MTMRQLHDFGPDKAAARCRHCGILNGKADYPDCQSDFTMGQWRKREPEPHDTIQTVHGTNWRFFDTAPDDGRTIQVWREDAGVFTAFYQSPSEPQYGPSFWCSEGGEDLTGDLPTLWQPMADPPPEPLFGLASANPDDLLEPGEVRVSVASDEWQPITTAPKDGRAIRLRVGTNDLFPVLMAWNDPQQQWEGFVVFPDGCVPFLWDKQEKWQPTEWAYYKPLVARGPG